jgi:WD40 repeat protein
MASLFVSHSSRDLAATKRVVERLSAEGFAALFLDFDPAQGIPAGRAWEPELYAQLRKTDGVIFLASAASVASQWCFAEVSLARSLGKPVFPLRLEAGVRLGLLDDVQWMDLAEGEAAFARLWAGLRRAGLDPADSFGWDPARSPYPGLESFAGEDAAVFFGRDQEIDRLLELLQPTLQRGGGRFVAIVGPSGSGKSSLLRAGLLPRLARLEARWVALPALVPGQQPTQNLARSLAGAFAARGHTRPLAEVAASLGRGAGGLVELAAELAQLSENGEGRPSVLVVVDQAEELLTRSGVGEQQAFLSLLDGALGDDSPVWVVATVRSEFLSTAPERAGLAEVVDDPLVVEPLSRARLPEVIQRPAQRAGLEFAPGLVERMVEETSGGDALPLLAYTLRELYQRTGPDGRVSAADYEAVGGVVGALQRRADRLAAELARRGQGRLVIPTLLQLAAVEGDGEPTRRRVRRRALRAEEQAVAEAFVDARLLTSSTGADGETTVEVAHEALLRQWPPLREAIEAARASLRLRSELERLAADWVHGRRDESYLLRGGRLTAFDRWAGEHGGELSPMERQFLEASRALASRELEAARRSNRRLRALTAGLSVLMVGAVVSATLAVRQTNRAELQTNRAELQSQRSDSRQLAAQAVSNLAHRPGLAMLLSLEAMRTQDTPQARSSLLAGLQHDPRLTGFIPNPHEVKSVAFSPDGRTLVAGDGAGGLSLWDVRRRSRTGDRFRAHTHAVLGLAFSPDGRTLASAGSVDRTAFQLQARSRAAAAPPLLVHKAKVRSAAFDRQTRLLAVGGDDGTVALWDLRGRRLLWQRPVGDGSPVLSVALPQDGRLVAAGDRAGTITLFGIAGGVRRRWLAGQSSVTSLAFGPDRRTLISGGSSGAISIWDTRDWTRRQLLGHTGSVVALALSRDRRLLASGGFDNSVMVWDLDRRQRVGPPLLGHTGPVFGIAFGRTPNMLASAANDGQIILWDLTAGQRLATPLPGSGKVAKVWFRPGGTIATGGTDGSVRLWDHRRRTMVDTLLGVPRAPSSMAFHPDASMLAMGGADGSVRLWDLRGHRPIGAPLHGHDKMTTALAFSRDGRRLVSGGGDGTVAVWDVERWQRIGGVHLHSDNTEVRVTSVAFSPDGRTLASGAIDARIALWDLATGRRFATLEGFAGPVKSLLFSPTAPVLAAGTDFGSVTLWQDAVAGRTPHPELLGRHTGQVTSLAFNADGTLLASGGKDHKVDLWNVATRQGLGAPFTGHTGTVTSLSFSQDGRLLASGGEDGNLLLWDLDVGSWQRRVCSIVRRSLSRLEWNAFISGRPYRPTCQ